MGGGVPLHRTDSRLLLLLSSSHPTIAHPGDDVADPSAPSLAGSSPNSTPDSSSNPQPDEGEDEDEDAAASNSNPQRDGNDSASSPSRKHLPRLLLRLSWIPLPISGSPISHSRRLQHSRLILCPLLQSRNAHHQHHTSTSTSTSASALDLDLFGSDFTRGFDFAFDRSFTGAGGFGGEYGLEDLFGATPSVLEEDECEDAFL